MSATATRKKRIQDRLRPNSIIKNHYYGYQRHKPRFIVGYWSIRGLGAPIRMLLGAAQIDHWVVLYDVVETEASDDSGGWDKSTWVRDKEWLKEEFPFVNLPFLVDCRDDTVVSQTNAILSYLGRELKMFGRSPREACRCDELLCEIMDLRNLMTRFAYDPNAEMAKEDAKRLVARASINFEKLERHLEMEYPHARDRMITDNDARLMTIGFYMNSVCHLLGGQFTAPDFHLWEMLDQFDGLSRHYEIDCLGTATTYSEKIDDLQIWIGRKEERRSIFPFLKEFHNSFIFLIANENYGTQYKLNYAVARNPIVLPYNNVYARFGSDPVTLGKYNRGQQAPWRNLGVVECTFSRKPTGIEYWDDEAVKEAAVKRAAMGWE